MTTITIEVDEDTERRLSELSSGAGISIQELTYQALLSYIEDMEDYRIAESRLRDNLPTIPLEEVVRRVGLED
jgi:RHH-type transcriptional regulator, rel operon repressor / antitoxin RelB